ncbi:SET domain protein [Methyloligella halotolerans]|uniref:SET domain protein n=1 Tax=Methyloligella halotolerans TaxID=1177755 RepID=A0A1E2RYK2_9HYPH|nr:SET domain-containing protein [Methyloligella halotolerans]ODA67316.1 SET domain protein [Methyloligella halotolerans]
MSKRAFSLAVVSSGPQGETAYLSPRCEVIDAPEKGGKTVVARAPIGKDELIAMWSGRLIGSAELATLPDAMRRRTVQVDEDLFLTSLNTTEGADMLNHSCAPNAGLRGQIGIVAMRDIAPGEEVTFDYAMCDSAPYDEFDCGCGAAECRGRVSGEDWRSPALWLRYDGYFSPYLALRIASLKGLRRAS